MTLGEALKSVSYIAKLNVVEYDEDSPTWRYLFPADEYVNRSVLEKHYPDLLKREMKDGFHGEGQREGIYCHI